MAEQRRPPVAPVTDRGAKTKTTAPACSTNDGQGRGVRAPPLSFAGPAGPAHGGGGRCSSRAPCLLVFLFLLFLSLLCTPSSSLGL
jgi:hypothetical protein